MTPDRIRWTDSRLDDAFETLRDEARALREVPGHLAELAVEMRHVQADTSACHGAVREVKDALARYIEDQARVHEAHRQERKADRRWMIGTVLTSAGLVIAALGLLTGHF